MSNSRASVRWEDVSDYVAAGNVMSIQLNSDLSDIDIEVIYGKEYTARQIMIQCHNYCFLDVRRRDDHKPGSALILEASLNTSSPLIDALHSNELDGLSGSTLRPQSGPVYHLEIVGEIHINVLSIELTFELGPEMPAWRTG